jgi:sensor histidine kinase YesM
MLIENNLSSNKTLFWLSAIVGAIIIYPNSTVIFAKVGHLYDCGETLRCISAVVFYFVYRYAYFVALCFILTKYGMKKCTEFSIQKIAGRTFLFALLAYGIYVAVAFILRWAVFFDWVTGLLILQFAIAWIIPLFMGHMYKLYVEQIKAQEEIEQLRTENLKSQCAALTNQINPHFFFNSLNGLSALARAGKTDETVAYIGKLSEVFRYILQSEKRGVVELRDELTFLNAYRYLLELRYGGKLFFEINISEEEKEYKIPVLSLLPLVENVVKHNRIDSEHKMNVSIYMDHNLLIFSNPICKKLDEEESNGIGLKNLDSRMKLQLGTDLHVENDNVTFKVCLPLHKD